VAHSSAFPYRLAAIDIDDTLVGPDRIISEANRDALQRLQDAGAMIALASGRSHANMVPFHQALGLETPLISANGALVREAPQGRVWAEHGLPWPLVQELIAAGRERGVSVLLYTLDGVYVDRRTEYTEYDQSRNDDPQILVPDLSAVRSGAIQKVLWMDSPSQVEALTAEMTAYYAGRLTVTHTDPPYLEFMPPGITKATGLADLARALGIDALDVVAFGDGNNDVQMLEWAGMGIAMSHAKPAAKAAADYTVPDRPVETSLAGGINWLFGRTGGRRR
jgi:Cof subfamily protein (haloacid dehalogenase superfamily)